MNHALGLAANGDLVALVSGWNNRPPLGEEPEDGFKSATPLGPWVCRSTDGGRRWTHEDSFPSNDNGSGWIPFGAIMPGEDGALRACAYDAHSTHAVMFRSDDDGRTWTDPVPIDASGNETAPLHLGGGRWLAAARQEPKPECGLILSTSDDDGRTWARDQRISGFSEHPGHLLRLADGRILVTYGIRTEGEHGVGIRFSDDEGRMWGEPMRLVDVPPRDCGYPSTAQLPGGGCVTLYYTGVPAAWTYEMRAAAWNPDRFPTAGT